MRRMAAEAKKPPLYLVPVPGGPGSVEEAVGAFLASKASQGAAKATMKLYSRVLDEFTAYSPAYPLANTTAEEVESFIASLHRRLARESVRLYFTVIRGFLRWAYRRRRIAEDPSEWLEKPRKRHKEINAFTEDQVRALLAQPDQGRLAGLRDYAMMLLLLDSGLRISEAVSLRVGQIDFAGGMILVVGKGGKERPVFFGPGTGGAMGEYLLVRGNSRPELWLSELGEPLRAHRLNVRLKRYAKQAGITGIRVSPHTFRHTFATFYLRNGGDVLSLQRIGGWADLAMVRRYSHETTEDLAAKHHAASPVDRLLPEKRGKS